jgi:hypothetical protein
LRFSARAQSTAALTSFAPVPSDVADGLTHGVHYRR